MKLSEQAALKESVQLHKVSCLELAEPVFFLDYVFFKLSVASKNSEHFGTILFFSIQVLVHWHKFSHCTDVNFNLSLFLTVSCVVISFHCKHQHYPDSRLNLDSHPYQDLVHYRFVVYRL